MKPLAAALLGSGVVLALVLFLGAAPSQTQVCHPGETVFDVSTGDVYTCQATWPNPWSAADTTWLLPVTHGGIGIGTITQGDVLYGSAANTLAALAAGTSGKPLVTAGGGANPSWATLGVAGGGTGLATLTTGAVQVGAGTSAVTQLAVQSCTSSAATTCTITVARSGCTPVCSASALAGSGTQCLKTAVVSGTTLTCTFTTSGTNTCNCLCP